MQDNFDYQGFVLVFPSLTDVVPEVSQLFLHFPIRPLIQHLICEEGLLATREVRLPPTPLDIPQTLELQHEQQYPMSKNLCFYMYFYLALLPLIVYHQSTFLLPIAAFAWTRIT